MDIPCVNERTQASVETVADEHDLTVTDAPAVVEAVAFLFAEEPAPKAPDKCTQLWYDDGDVAMDETVAYMFADEPVPKAPDKYALCWSDVTMTERDPVATRVVSSGFFWWESSVPLWLREFHPTKISCMNGMALLLEVIRVAPLVMDCWFCSPG